MNTKERFWQIKEMFFPRWDRRNRWKIRTWSRRNLEGFCDRKKRVIEIVGERSNQDEQDLLLIHEICHAIHSGHGRAWVGRMKKAAGRATELGRDRLAELLEKEIDGYRQSPSSSAERAEFYEAIVNIVHGIPDVTLRRAITIIAREKGLLESEVCKQFPRTESVFREAQEDARCVWGPDQVEMNPSGEACGHSSPQAGGNGGQGAF
jgi:hypothetical protein